MGVVILGGLFLFALLPVIAIGVWSSNYHLQSGRSSGKLPGFAGAMIAWRRPALPAVELGFSGREPL
jgi:hypothetical protein